jgi:FKBP-type peptidyl-prolyl cis-trans isomerase 2
MTSRPDEKAPVKDGELVMLDYELWSETGGRTELVDTTREEVARAENIPIPDGALFGARPHLVGGDDFPVGIEKAIVGAKVGEDVEREFEPSDAFGEKDPKLIELFSMHEVARLPEMRRDDADLNVGTVLTIRGRRGRVVSLTAARVRVDFNPAFAGRKIRGKFRIVSKLHEPAEQAKALIELGYGRSKEFDVQVADDVVTVRVPERSKFDFAWMAAKPRVIDRIRSHLKPKSIRVVEEYVTPTPAAKDAPKPADGAEKAAAKPAHDHAPKDAAKSGEAASKPAHEHASKDSPKAGEASEKPAAKAAHGHPHEHPAKTESSAAAAEKPE